MRRALSYAMIAGMLSAGSSGAQSVSAQSADAKAAGTPHAGAHVVGTPNAGTQNANLPNANLPNVGTQNASNQNTGTQNAGSSNAVAPDTTGPVRARLECEPARAEIGEPVEWILTVEHPRDIVVHLPEKDPATDDTWVMLGQRSVVNDVRSNAAGDTITRATWRLMSLESGARALPGIDVRYEYNGTPHTATAAPIALEVGGELGPDENAPRPMKGFRPPPTGAEHVSHWPWIAGFVLAVSAIAVWIWRRRKRTPAPIPRATPLDRLAGLEREISADPNAGRSITYAVSMLLRESVDAFAHESRAGLTDQDWIERTEKDERLPIGVRSASARILRESEQVKYALQVPTRFAVEEMLRDAHNALEALAAAPAPDLSASVAGSSAGSDKEAA